LRYLQIHSLPAYILARIASSGRIKKEKDIVIVDSPNLLFGENDGFSVLSEKKKMPVAKQDVDASLIIPSETFKAVLATPYANEFRLNLVRNKISQKIGIQEDLKKYLNTDMVGKYYQQITQKYGVN